MRPSKRAKSSPIPTDGVPIEPQGQGRAQAEDRSGSQDTVAGPSSGGRANVPCKSTASKQALVPVFGHF